MKVFRIDEQTLVALLNYLVQRPYAEVHEGIKALQSLEQIEEKAEVETSKK